MHFPDLDSFLFNPTIYSLICCIPFLNCFPKTPVAFNFSLLFICFQVSFFLRFMFLTWFVLISLPLFFPFLNNFWTPWYLISGIYSSSDKSSAFRASILLKDRGKLDSAEAVCLCWGRHLHQFLAFRWLLSIPWNPMTHNFLCYDVSILDSSPFDTLPRLHQYSLVRRQNLRKWRWHVCAPPSPLPTLILCGTKLDLKRHSSPVLFISFLHFPSVYKPQLWV